MIVQIVITTFVVSNFTLATFMDPGVIPKGESSSETGESDIRVTLPFAPRYHNLCLKQHLLTKTLTMIFELHCIRLLKLMVLKSA